MISAAREHIAASTKHEEEEYLSTIYYYRKFLLQSRCTPGPCSEILKGTTCLFVHLWSLTLEVQVKNIKLQGSF